MADWERVRRLVLEAGRLARRMRAEAAVHRKADASFVTDADLAVQEYLIRGLGEAFPGDGFVAEEQGVGRGPSASPRVWVLDPIDGTASYATGLPGWGVAVGLVVEGRAEAGCFYMPQVEAFFEAAPGLGMRMDGRPAGLKPPRPLERETALFVDSGLHRRLTLDPTFPGKVRSLGSTVAHLAYVAAGCADAAVMHDVHVWDLAAGVAMLRHAGGVLRYLDGEDVALADYLRGEDTLRPMVAGHPETVARVAALLSPRG